MKGKLTGSQIDFVLEHLGHHAQMDPHLHSFIAYGTRPVSGRPLIHIPASEDALDTDRVIWMDGIPILYPLGQQSDSCFTMHDKQLHFHHDLLKSIFHLLSGYEEIKSAERDQYDRFPYSQSIQSRLNIINKPVVNYYMEILLDGMQLFCDRNDLSFRRNPRPGRPALMLSHDVDLIDAYDFRETAYKFKQLLGLAPSPLSMKEKTLDAFSALFHFLNPLSGKNPFWSFPKLMEWERERGFRSTYFFLEKDGKYDNSRYRFHDKKISKLLMDLSDQGHEIGIHGTMQSFDNAEAMGRTLENLKSVCPEPIRGIRQHYLRFRPGHTAGIQAQLGLSYDASLGFSEHEGFRNSYCWPFKFYDFEKQQTLDHWEIPLTLMDVTHFHHRKLNPDQSLESFRLLAQEVVKFKGVFSLLWHNSFFDERLFPGITAHYIRILDELKNMGMESLTGMEIIRRMEGKEIWDDQIPG